MSLVKKGDKIRVTKEAQGHWGHIIYPVGSEWVVKEVITPDTGTVFAKGMIMEYHRHIIRLFRIKIK